MFSHMPEDEPENGSKGLGSGSQQQNMAAVQIHDFLLKITLGFLFQAQIRSLIVLLSFCQCTYDAYAVNNVVL